MSQPTILDGIQSPQDIKHLSATELEQLAGEIRSRIVQVVSQNGGHLASNLGAVELTLALHKVLNTPQDKLVFDVGHQAYTHKLLTGRAAAFCTLRQYGGISGFPLPSESPHDAFGAGHSSTAISAALGMVRARELLQEDYRVVAVVGDGALTGGMIWEALNDAGNRRDRLVVVLNDNEMSISNNVGAIASYLGRLRASRRYTRAKARLKKFLTKVPLVGAGLSNSIERLKNSLKYLLLRGMYFEEMGWTYLGPIDGHDIDRMVENLHTALAQEDGPVLLHVVTQKGRGYRPAEEQPQVYHGPGQFDPESGCIYPGSGGMKKLAQVSGEALLALAGADAKLCAVTAAMPSGCGLEPFAGRYPNRYFDVGIAEQHAVTMVAGMAAQGLHPVFCVYSTFLQRAYDQLLHDVCLQNLPVVLSITHCGLVGEDGVTHQGIYTLSYLNELPNLTILSPSCGSELRLMLEYALEIPGPVAVCYPAKGPMTLPDVPVTTVQSLRSSQWQPIWQEEGSDTVLLTFSGMLIPALEAAKRVGGVDVVSCRWLKPLPEQALTDVFQRYRRVYTLEDNALSGGFGSTVLQWANERGWSDRVGLMGHRDTLVQHGDLARLYRDCGLDAAGIATRIAQERSRT